MLLFLRVKYKKTKLFLTKYLGRGRVIFKNYQITKPFNPFNTTLFIASAEPDTALLTKVTMLCTVFFHTKKYNAVVFAVCTVFNLEFLWEDIIIWKILCMQFVAYEITFPTMSNLYIIILILFARFLAKRITSIFIQDFCLKKNDKIFNLIFLKKSYSSKNYSENIIVFIISFYFHLYQNRNLFC